jgi:bifunctional UDP-N-acetylglucosamine pyrophosphorylase/glucosamine-1-phosphate N-acetyltransferase
MPTRIVILAAGKGTRMNAELPKVLVPFQGKPIIRHLLEAVRDSKVYSRPIVVVGENNQAAIAEALKNGGMDCEYVLQKEQLGTGDAVRAAEGALTGHAGAVMVLYGDHPLLSAATIAALDEAHRQSGAVLTMMTVTVESYEGWQAPLYDFSRVVRDVSGRIVATVEKKDASPEQLAIKEVNPCFFCFDAKWLWANLAKLDNDNQQHEYYLPDLVGIAIRAGDPIASVPANPRESIGVNTPEQLAEIERQS